MKTYVQQLNDITQKISNYNNIIAEIEKILGADYRYILSLLKQDGIITTKRNDNLYNKIAAALSTYYYGWFESLDLKRSWEDYVVNARYDKPTKIFNIDDVKRIMSDEYSEEYSKCYKDGELNEVAFLDLAIKILENQITKIHNFALIVSQSKTERIDKTPKNIVREFTDTASSPSVKLFMLVTLNKNTEMDLSYFQNMLHKLGEIKRSLTYNQVTGYLKGIKEEDIKELDKLLSMLPIYLLTDEEIELIKFFLNPTISSEILKCYGEYSAVNITSKPKEVEKRMTLTNVPLN